MLALTTGSPGIRIQGPALIPEYSAIIQVDMRKGCYGGSSDIVLYVTLSNTFGSRVPVVIQREQSGNSYRKLTEGFLEPFRYSSFELCRVRTKVLGNKVKFKFIFDTTPFIVTVNLKELNVQY